MNYTDFVKARKNYIGASDAATIMGVSPWGTQLDLWEDKLGLRPDRPDNFAMARGRELEPIARDAYMIQTGHIVTPKQVFHPTVPYMMANLDGITDDGSVCVEIKCPGAPDHDLAVSGKVPDKYFPQLQHQMAVTGLQELHYFSYRNGDTALVVVKLDSEYVKRLYIEEAKFWECVESLTPPELTARDYVERDDIAWNEFSDLYKQCELRVKLAEDVCKAVKEQQDACKAKLIELANGKSSIGNGLKLNLSSRKGAVDYSMIPEMKNVDIEKYRKPSSIAWKITV